MDEFKVGDYAEVIEVPTHHMIFTGKILSKSIGGRLHKFSERKQFIFPGDIVKINDTVLLNEIVKVNVVMGKHPSNNETSINIKKLKKIEFKEN